MIALDPNQTFDFHIDADAFKPKRRRLLFTSRFPTHLQLLEIDRLLEEAERVEKESPPDKAKESAKAVLLQALAVVGVRIATPAPGSADEMWQFTLDIDADKPLEQQTVFHLHRLSMDQLEQAKELIQSSSSASQSEQADALKKTIALCVDRIAPARGIDTTQAILDGATMEELREIVRKAYILSRLSHVASLSDLENGYLVDVCIAMYRNAKLSENDRKKSALRASVAAKSSANAAAGV